MMGVIVGQSASGQGELGISSPTGKTDPTKVGHTDCRCPRPPHVKHTMSAEREGKGLVAARRGAVTVGRANGLAGLATVVVGLVVGALVAGWSFGAGGGPLFQPPDVAVCVVKNCRLGTVAVRVALCVCCRAKADPSTK